MPKYRLRYFDDLHDEEHTREEHIDAPDDASAADIARERMLDADMRVQIDNETPGGAKNTQVYGRP